MPCQEALLNRIGLPSNTATSIALLVRIELLCFVAGFGNKYTSLRIQLLLHKLRQDGFSARGGLAVLYLEALDPAIMKSV